MSTQWTTFFEDANGRGWTEKLWWGGTLTDINVQIVAGLVGNARANILAQDCKILRIRVESNLPRGPFIVAVGTGSGLVGGYPVKAADAELRLLLRPDDGLGHYNKTFLGGIPSDQVQGDNYLAFGSFPLLLQTYFNSLVNNLFQIRSTLGIPGVFTNATLLTPFPPRGYRFQSVTPTGLTPATVIRMKQAREIGYNGRKTVTQILTNTPVGFDTVTVGGAAPVSAEPAGTSAQWEKVVALDYSYLNLVIEGIVGHKTGRPFGLPRGRRTTVLPLRA